jgi:hypothetical protein
MQTRIEAERIIALIKNAPTAMFHLIVGSNERGMVFFACEQAPLLTFQSKGLPARCPICGTKNPLMGETNQQGQ